MIEGFPSQGQVKPFHEDIGLGGFVGGVEPFDPQGFLGVDLEEFFPAKPLAWVPGPDPVFPDSADRIRHPGPIGGASRRTKTALAPAENRGNNLRMICGD